MPWPDDVALLQDGCLDAFGERVVYIPDNAPSIEVSGIFRAMHREIDPQTGVVIETTQPECDVRVADLPRSPRATKDRMLIRGQDYIVRDSRVDGEGMVKLFLHEARTT